MNQGNHSEHLTIGSLQNFLAMVVCLCTGIVTAGLLSRHLGPGNYGILTVTVTIVLLIETFITDGLKRTTVKFIAEDRNWRIVARKAVHLQLALGTAAAVLLYLFSPVLASILNTPGISFYLRYFSIYLPVGALTGIYRSILIAQGYYRAEAILNSIYWITRLILILGMLFIELTITTTLIANFCATLLVLIISSKLLDPLHGKGSAFQYGTLFRFSWPLSLFILLNAFLGKVDLLFVKKLVSMPQVTGYYSAAQNLAIVPLMLAGFLGPLLLSKVSHLTARNQSHLAVVQIRNMERFMLCLLPFAAMAAGAAPEITAAIYGGLFVDAGPLLAVLIFGTIGNCLTAIGVFTLVAAGKPKLPLLIVIPVIPPTIVLYTIFVPRHGAIAAAVISTVIFWALATAMMFSSYKSWKTLPSVMTLLKSALICILAYLTAKYWQMPDLLLLIKIPMISLVILILFYFSGELSREELRFFFRIFTGTPSGTRRTITPDDVLPQARNPFNQLS